MLRILRQRCPIRLDAQQAYEFQKQAAAAHPLIGEVRREYFRRLGLGPEEVETWMQREQQLNDSPLLGGDVVLKDSETLLYYRIPRDEDGVEAGVITRGDPAEHVEFFDLIGGILRGLSGQEVKWTSAGIPGEISQTIQGESEEVKPTAREVDAARELENESAQKLVGQILQTGSIFFNKLTQALPPAERGGTERNIKRFEDLGVVSKDFAVLCRKTGQQILRVSSRAAIEDPSQKNFKCFICGNPVSEESLDEIITVTDFGRKLLENDYWLVVRVLGALAAAGIESHEVRVHTGEGHLTNFFVTLNDQLYMFVLTNQKLSLEKSYVISAHVAAYQLAHVIVISTSRVSRLMRHHLEQCNPGCQFDFLDTLLGLEDRLLAILRQKEKAVLRGVLDNFASLTPVHVQDLIMQRVSPSADFYQQPPERKPAPAAPARPAEAAAPAAPALEPIDGAFSMMGEVLEAEETLPEESQVTPS